MEDLGLDLSGIPVALRGLPAALAERLRAEWPAFVTAAPARPFLELQVVPGLLPAADGPYRPKQMNARYTADTARFAMPEGTAEIERGGVGRVQLAAGDEARAYYTLVNFLRAGLAWRLPERGAALLHAAGLVLDGRAFLLVGGEGAGKSTWAALGGEAGAEVLTDDLLIVEAAASPALALGGPFRSTHRAPQRPGRWPIAALLFPRHGQPARLAQAAPLIARARITANLPFVTEALGHDPYLDATLERLAALPCAELQFGRDAGFIPLLQGSFR